MLKRCLTIPEELSQDLVPHALCKCSYWAEKEVPERIKIGKGKYNAQMFAGQKMSSLSVVAHRVYSESNPCVFLLWCDLFEQVWTLQSQLGADQNIPSYRVCARRSRAGSSKLVCFTCSKKNNCRRWSKSSMHYRWWAAFSVELLNWPSRQKVSQRIGL